MGALICSIAAFVACPVIPAIVALVLAPTARRKIAESRGTLEGESLCTVATILAWVNIGLAAVGVIVLVIVLAVAANDESALAPLAAVSG